MFTASLTKLSFKKDAPKLLPMNGKEKKGNVQNNKQLPNAEIIICTHDKTGKTENLERFVFASERPESEKLLELTEVKGRMVSIAIKNPSEAKFEYQSNALQL